MYKLSASFRIFSLSLLSFSAIFLLAVCADAATFTVTKTADTNNNGCSVGNCSLREAIEAANAAPGDDVIEFDPAAFATPQVITFDFSFSLRVTGNGTLTINGTGADKLAISGRNTARVFIFMSQSNVTLRRMTISDGNGFGNSAAGGGCIITNNSVSTLEDVVVTNCRTTVIKPVNFVAGGGIYNFGGTMNIINSRIQNNSAFRQGAQSADGGGIYNSGTLTIRNSSITGNTSQGHGGGIGNNGTMNIYNSTISGNFADFETDAFGGGIANFVYANLVHTTVANNRARVAAQGIYSAPQALFNSRNSIYADNVFNTTEQDFNGTMTSYGYNLVENTAGTTVTGDATGNIFNLDPILQPLQIGATGLSLFHKPAANSPVIDKGKTFDIFADQRSVNRPVDLGGYPNAPGGDGADIGAVELQITDFPKAPPFDFDGDRKTDVSIFRPAGNQWWINRSFTNTTGGLVFGGSNDKLVPADYTGDGKADVAIFRPANSGWYILRSEDSTFYAFPFGASADVPAPGDFDGDGTADPAIYRPANGEWYILRSSDGGVTALQFGIAEDKPVVADYDGDRRDDVAIFRPSTGAWWILRSSAGLIAVGFGQAGDKTVPGDYTGDGKADIAFWRESDGFWYILRSENFSYYGIPFGSSGDLPLTGDFDGDGKSDAAIYRPSNSGWYLMRSTAGTTSLQFGITGDYPIPNVYVR